MTDTKVLVFFFNFVADWCRFIVHFGNMLSISALQNVAPQNSKLNSLIGQTQAFMFKTREQLFLRCFGQSRGIPHGKTSAYQAGLEAKAVFL